jgi:hypothetical protein
LISNPDMMKQLEALSLSDLNTVTLPEESLLVVLRDASSSSKARLIACEILVRRDPLKYRDVLDTSSLSALSVTALRASTFDLNWWGFLRMDEVGPLGERLITLGEGAIPALIPLLDIHESAGVYSGSVESKEGNSDQPRVSDFAAFFIAKIKDLPYHFHRDDDSLRDAEIERLKKALDESL